MHDTQRLNEHDDPEHGARAAGLLLAEPPLLRWPLQRMELLELALRSHDRGRTTQCPVVGACWDSDRLTIGRVWIEPDPRYFSCLSGSRFEHAVARAEQIQAGPDLAWDEIAAAYLDLVS